MQIRDGIRRVARYESGVWSATEATYDAGKLECRAVLKAFKKFRYWLYGVHFTLETDVNTLVAQLNRPASDLPGALVTRWLAWIRLFDFDVKHISGKKNGAADGLSRRPATKEELRDQALEPEIDDFIDTFLVYVWRFPLLRRRFLPRILQTIASSVAPILMSRSKLLNS